MFRRQLQHLSHPATSCSTHNIPLYTISIPFCPGPLTRSSRTAKDYGLRLSGHIYTHYSGMQEVDGCLGVLKGVSWVAKAKECCPDAWARPSYATRRCTRWHINVRCGTPRRTCPSSHLYLYLYLYLLLQKTSKLSNHFRCHRCHCPICLMNCQNDIHWRLTCNKRNETKQNEMKWSRWHGLNKNEGRSLPEISFFKPFYACPYFHMRTMILFIKES